MIKILSVLILSAFSFGAFASNEIYCESKNYTLKIAKEGNDLIANYAVDGVLNTGADVFVEELYVSDRIITASLNVDSQERLIEFTAIKNKQNFYQGKIFFANKTQRIDCYKKDI